MMWRAISIDLQIFRAPQEEGVFDKKQPQELCRALAQNVGKKFHQGGWTQEGFA